MTLKYRKLLLINSGLFIISSYSITCTKDSSGKEAGEIALDVFSEVTVLKEAEIPAKICYNDDI